LATALTPDDRRGQLRLDSRRVQGLRDDARGRQSEARGLAYIAESKKLFPNKPIRYVFNTHPHSDHTGGLPPLVAEGATIITSKNNQEFFERALNTRARCSTTRWQRTRRRRRSRHR
jgi:glyoxylase-like metal-dependent hydrolase (beta-lactamase superfamily II)